MCERYQPESEFLKAVIAEQAPLSGGEFGEANLRRLIDMTRDEDRANRDWATFLLAQEDTDTIAVRDALLRAAQDHDDAVRAEAVFGLAKRDRDLALPLVQEALRADAVSAPVLHAAALCAHPSLIEDLRIWAAPSDNPFLDKLAAKALTACEQRKPAVT